MRQIPQETITNVPLTGLAAIGGSFIMHSYSLGAAPTAHGLGGGMSKVISVTPGVPVTILADIGYLYSYVRLSVFDAASGFLTHGSINFPGTVRLSFTPVSNTITLSINMMSNYQTAPSNGLFTLTGLKVSRTGYRSEPMIVQLCDDERDKYQFGFNGQMKMNEVAGMGNWNTAQFWEYDTRTATRKNRDPKPNSAISPYSVFAGNPILYSDIAGDTITIKKAEYIDGATVITTLTCKFSEAGGYEFFKPDGTKYSVSGDFVSEVATAITEIAKTKTGKVLVNSLMAGPQFEIMKSKVSSFSFETKTLRWNPQNKTSGFNQNGNELTLPWIDLAHEFAHGESAFKGNSFIDKTWWKSDGGSKASWDEVYASHVENKIRAESNQPLRTHYATEVETDALGNKKNLPAEKTRLLGAGTNNSLHMDKDENLNIGGLNGRTPYNYSK